MGLETRSFDVYGFKIEVHAGGRRVWPPSFKRFIKRELDDGRLTIGDIMRTCNVSQSLVYKWGADVRRASSRQTTVREERIFSEVVFEETKPTEPVNTTDNQILLRGREIEISLPLAYPVDDLVTVILALEGRT
ncbi:MAG: hypothetical protein ABJL72_16470 [Roseobacter sp.]